jgi:uncharacterized membrane protein
MRFCEDCGSQLADNSQVCAACFNRTQASHPMAATAAPIAPPAAGLQPPMAAALSYLAGVITGILFLVLEPFKADRFVRFHAFQSIFFNIAWIGLWIAWIIVEMVLGAITKGLFFIIQVPIDLLIMVGGFCLWAFLMYRASQGKTFKLPIIGAIAAKQAGL